MAERIRIGVLALQGSFSEHLDQVKGLEGALGVEVRTVGELETVDAIILPGGESTALRRLMDRNGFREALKARILNGMPVWGTCAGMILLADEILGESPHLGVLNATVSRNAYGSQLDSFQTVGTWLLDGPAKGEMIFIRAPRFEGFRAPATAAAMLDGQVTGVVQGHILATAFHPELIGDLTPYRWLLKEAVAYQGQRGEIGICACAG